MAYFIDNAGRYYEGDRVDPSHQGVPRRPGPDYDFVNGAWTYVALPPPNTVTMRQARLALLDAGLLPDVNAAVAAMAGTAGDAARIEWEYALSVDRNSPLVANLSAALGLTDPQLDALFAAASGL